jgi:hypothetical protein
MKKYIISSYIPGAKTDEKVINTLQFIADDLGAELKVFPNKANYVDEQGELPDLFLPEEGGKYLNNNLYVSDMLVNHNLVDPISGLESIASEKGSLIVPSPTHRFKSVARSLKHHAGPRGIWCTGSVSESYYKDTKSGLRKKGYHVKGALLVEVKNNEIFSIRQLTYANGSICDLNKQYTSNGIINIIRPSISLGDLHPPFTCNHVISKTMRLLKDLNVKNIIFHDSFDASSISHHVEGKHLTKALVANSIPSLKTEVELTSSTMNLIMLIAPKDMKAYVAKSNHDEHLDRYLDEFRFKTDYTNLLYALDLVKQKVKFKQGDSSMDSLEFALKEVGLDPRVKFLERDGKLDIHGYECSNHGDYGPNGARGTASSHGLSFTGGKTVTGHAHTPEIGVYGNSVNGTMTKLTLPYTNDSGTSGWINTHTIIYPNGTFTHYHIIKE